MYGQGSGTRHGGIAVSWYTKVERQQNLSLESCVEERKTKKANETTGISFWLEQVLCAQQVASCEPFPLFTRCLWGFFITRFSTAESVSGPWLLGLQFSLKWRRASSLSMYEEHQNAKCCSVCNSACSAPGCISQQSHALERNRLKSHSILGDSNSQHTKPNTLTRASLKYL